MAESSAELRMPKDYDLSEISAYDDRVSKLQDTILSFTNPWSVESISLVSLCSGRIASESVEKNLLNAEELGEAALQDLMTERLVDRTKDLRKSIRQLKLQSFSSTPKKVSKSSETVKVIKSDRQIFARLLEVTSTRTVDMREVMQYSLSPVSLPLAATTGDLCTTSKAALLTEFLKMVPSDEDIFDIDDLVDSALIIDAMAVIQALPQKIIPKTFGQLAALILDKIVSMVRLYSASRVDFVGDRYPAISIRNLECTRRGADDSTRIEIRSGDQKISMQW